MKNNQLTGSEHFEELKSLVKNHPSLTVIDFSNSETNINKNKLKNIGV
jgi:RNA processing factor Prp31